MYIGIHVKCPLFLSYFNKNLIFGQIFEKYTIIGFHENPPSGSRVFFVRTDGQTDRHKETNSRFSQF